MNNNTEPRDFSDLRRRPGHLIRRLHQIHVALFLEECQEFNLTPVQFGVLTVLNDHGTLDQVTIASLLGIDRNTAADVIRRLERRELLERPASITDKRAKLASITEKGHKIVDAVQPAMFNAQRRFVKPLNDEEYKRLMELMEKLIQENNEEGRAPWRPSTKKAS